MNPLDKEDIFQKSIPYFLTDILVFYALPLLGGSTGAFMLILLVLTPAVCLVTALLFALKNGWKWWFAPAACILFIPCVFLYYNSSAWVYCPIFFLASLIGGLIGGAIHMGKNKNTR